MISDEAVEAAARAWIAEFEPRDDAFARMYTPTEIERRAIRAALEAALPHLLASQEKVGAMLDDIDGGLELLRLAVAAQDPKDEVLYRVKDLVADVEHLRTLAHPQKGGEG